MQHYYSSTSINGIIIICNKVITNNVVTRMILKKFIDGMLIVRINC